MKDAQSFPYYVEHKRALTKVERDILNFIIKDSHLEIFEEQMMNLKIIARCGCGECPTVLFGETFDNHPITHGQEVAHYTGNTSTGKKVGIVLMAVNNHLTELEAYDPTGEGVKGWPELDTLQKI